MTGSTPVGSTRSGGDAFRLARDFLLDHRTDYDTAYRDFRWPELTDFNWAVDVFDVMARANERPALWIVEEDGSEQQVSFAAMSRRSGQLAGWLRAHGVARGDRLILMLGNQLELWETILAAMKLGAVVIPASTLLSAADLRDRVARGGASHVVVGSADAGRFADVAGGYTRIAVGEPVSGWLSYADSRNAPADFAPGSPTKATDPLLLYFTSGTTAAPKLVEHTHTSYPVGNLSTMYWIGLRPGDVHLNISSPGWAKHAWSNVYAPWSAEATVLIYNYTRFDAGRLLDVMVRCGVTSFCAPPTVWRMLIQADLAATRVPLREAVGAGEPLNPEVIARVRDAWGITIRDGYGQTETTAQIGNPPGQRVVPGSMGRPLPGYAVALVDPVSGAVGDEGEIALPLEDRPAGLMTGYRSPADTDEEWVTASIRDGVAASMRDGYYRTGDVASRDADGYLTYVGRADDVFKASDYRISPFELESVLIEHPAVAEAAIVASPHPIRLAVPKAYVVLAVGHKPTAATAASILAYARERLAAYKRIRRLEFAELPKTISGKIRRVELREREHRLRPGGEAAGPDGEYDDGSTG
ncbi:MAG: AMP-binding protein [Mycobacteriales bacterium]